MTLKGKNTIRDEDCTALFTAYTVDTVNTVDTVGNVENVYTVYTFETALHCLKSSIYAYTIYIVCIHIVRKG